MVDPKLVKMGEHVRIWVTGEIGEHDAKVVGHDDLGYAELKITDDDSWSQFTLRMGDYGIVDTIGERTST